MKRNSDLEFVINKLFSSDALNTLKKLQTQKPNVDPNLIQLATKFKDIEVTLQTDYDDEPYLKVSFSGKEMKAYSSEDWKKILKAVSDRYGITSISFSHLYFATKIGI